MKRWYRVFGGSEVQPAPGMILEHLNGLGRPVTGSFQGDEAGWLRAELTGPGLPLLELERFLAGEEGIRAELNSWAAYVESCGDSPDHFRLMERLIQTRQVFTLRCLGEGEDNTRADELCLALCRFLAGRTEGI